MSALGGTIAGAFAFDKIASAFNETLNKGDELQDLANRFGVSASALQEIGNTASLSGAGLDDVAAAMGKLAKNAGEAVAKSGDMRDAFSDIGLSVENLKTMSPQDLFYALSEAVSSGKLGMEKFSVVTELAGRSAGSLMETLEMGPAAIRETGKSMGVWSDQTTAALSEARDSIAKFDNAWTVLKGNFLSGMMSINAALIKNPSLFFDWEKLQLQIEKSDSGKRRDRISKAASKTANQDALESDRRQKKKDAEELLKFKKEIEIKNADYAQSLMDEAAADERKRARELQFKREDFQRGLAEARKAADKMTADANANKGIRGIKASSATQELDTLAAADPQLAAMIEKERKKQADKQAQNNLETFNNRVLNETSALTPEGAQRTMQSRREELIKKDVTREASGTKTLADIYQVLNDALREITSTPRVGAN